ncbi:MAG TPA: pyruvate dehydrogenase (acetyl-transferring), homodimeric type [Bryobacteraceae bacterium]|nr:pyruvate dehydrogenase (acetyl-transferring), homodimeric type [Bryobacteraceae bacterium]
MLKLKVETHADLDPQETGEWLEALDQIIDQAGPDRAKYLLEALVRKAAINGVEPPITTVGPYVNTIGKEEEIPYPGDLAIEKRLRALVRWNALAMVVRANKYDAGIGGHIATFASQATLIEVGQNHFYRASINGQPGDLVYFQGHASPGQYSRAFLEGRLNEKYLENFRHELREHPGLSSYPHPWLMQDFWQFPTVSMGLGPINSIYQARFMRYLENRGLLAKTDRRVWAYLGDGEMDEPESYGAIRIATSEKLDNLVWIINCNLQRLDGPVRGNGSVVRELEGLFRGAGWNVIKLLWGSEWDALLAKDKTGLLVQRMEECVDGEFQNFKAKGGAYIRQEFFGKYPELLELVKDMSDEELGQLRRGGHDSQKIYNAYHRAIQANGRPTVILAKTIKGYGMGDAGEARNFTHQQKKLDENQLIYVRNRFNVPITDEQAMKCTFLKPADDTPEMQYLHARRQDLGGYLPARRPVQATFAAPALENFKDALQGSNGRELSTTMAFVRILTTLLKDPELGKYVVPIIPDEARTFGMDSLFRQVGIYASQGQLYKPVDADMFLYYHESVSGQILEEGITEAGSMGSFTAAGTAYANYGLPMIPFYTYYSMFGFQRVGDMAWAFADSRGKGFLLGATAGRTTLSGEGLQHQDGHSLVLSSTVPTCRSYDPAFAYEIAIIIQDGIKRMYELNEDAFYYLTICNDDYAHPAMPEGVNEGVLKGLYKYRAAESGDVQALLFGSGAIFNEAAKAQEILRDKYGVATDLYSATSYNELRRDCLEVERWNRLHPTETPRMSYLDWMLNGSTLPVIAATDYMKIVPDQIAPWVPGQLVSLGTDGFGRSDNREYLRKHFEVNAAAIAAATLSQLAREGKFDAARAAEAILELGLSPERPDPAKA